MTTRPRRVVPVPRSTLRRRIRQLTQAGSEAPTWHLHIGLIALVLIGMAVLLALFVASPVARAPFRMLAQADFVAFTAKGDAHLAFEIVDWELRGLLISGTSESTPVVISRGGEADKAVAERIELWLREGDELSLQRLPDRFGRPRYALSLPQRRVPVGMQLADAANQPLQVAHGTDLRPLAMEGTLRGQIGGRAEAALVFSAARVPDETRPRVVVSALGFGRPVEDGRVRAGLQGGSLVFLDRPDAELRLWRGADLRLRDIDAELAALVLTADGIEVQVVGVTSDATMHVGTSARTHQMRRVMPTYYDKLKGEPMIAVLVGFAGALAALGGLLLSAAQISVKLAASIRRIGGE